MRKTLWLMFAAVLIIVVAIHWWPMTELPVSIVPGWHTTILSPWLVWDLVASAGVLLVAFAIVGRQLSGGNDSERGRT